MFCISQRTKSVDVRQTVGMCFTGKESVFIVRNT